MSMFFARINKTNVLRSLFLNEEPQNEPPRSKLRGICNREDYYHLSNLRFLKLFPLSGDPVASYRELQVKIDDTSTTARESSINLAHIERT
jgi:hypothetical protein